jgi:hypothetical protein
VGILSLVKFNVSFAWEDQKPTVRKSMGNSPQHHERIQSTKLKDKFMFKKLNVIWGVWETDIRYPDPNTITEGAWIELLQYYKQIPNLPSQLSLKWMGLKSLGLEDEEIEKLCKPIDYDSKEVREEIMKGVGELCLKEQKELRKWNKQRRLEEQELTNAGQLQSEIDPK